jgi:hypothetical protein
MRSRALRTYAPVPAPPRPYWHDAEGTATRPEKVLELLEDPANQPAAGTPEWHQLRSDCLSFARTYPDHPAAGDFLTFVHYELGGIDGVDDEERTAIEGFEASPGERGPQNQSSSSDSGGLDPARRLQIPVADLNENDLISWAVDRSWDDFSRFAFANELARRAGAGRIDPRNLSAVQSVLVGLDHPSTVKIQT